MEVAALKGSEVGQEERREGSPGKGGLGRSCLGFGNLGGGGEVHTGRHTDRRDKQRRLSLVIIQTHTLILPDPPTEPQQPPSSDNFTPKESPERGGSSGGDYRVIPG